MLTPEQIGRTNDLFARNHAPEAVAEVLGMSMSTFRYHLRESGWRIKSDTVRYLEPLVPVAPQEQESAEVLLAA